MTIWKPIRSLGARVFIGAAALFSLAACHSADNSGFRLAPAPSAIHESFDVTTFAKSGTGRRGGFVLGLKKSSLEKYFLLIPQLRSGGATGHVNLFEPQVVYFKMAGGQVGLFELNTARIYDDVTTDNLLQTFAVTFETPDFVYFDWDYGLSAIVARSPYAGGSAGAKRLFTEGSDQLLDVVQSFIDRAEFKDNVLRVRQISRVREAVLRFRKDPSELTAEDGGEVGVTEMRDSTMTMDLVLRPYESAAKTIAPRWSKLDKGFGYFTRLMARAGSAEPREAILRWDTDPTRGPIRVRVSRNVPAHLLPAVREGIEYWNRVLGRPVLKVETGVDPSAELEERSVMVHWVDWRDAGFAYAGFQSDPLTGEILQGQIFMTSSWMLTGQSYEDLRGSLTDRVAPRVQALPVGARPLASSCTYHADAGSVWTTKAPAALTETALPHVIRGVVAHEMGHVMGLRHNFAGSYYNGVDEELHFNSAREFLKTGAIAALPTTISIMDYANAIDDVMNGKYIQSGVLSYDQSVIDWGYAGNESRKSLPFCADEQMAPDKKSIGCDVFDSSRHPAAFDSRLDTLNRGRGLWRDFAQIMNALKPDAQSQVDLNDVLNAKEKLGANVPPAANFATARALFTEAQKTHDTKDLKNWERPDDAAKAQKAAWHEQGDRLGLIALFELALPFRGETAPDGTPIAILDAKYWDRQIEAMVQSPRFSQGRNYNDVAYDLSADQTAKLRKFFEVKLTPDPYAVGLKALTQAFPGPDRVVVNTETGKPEKKTLKYQEFATLKAQMPEVLARSLTLMRDAKSVTNVVLGTASIDLPVRRFAPATFADFAGLFDPRYNPNSSAALTNALIVGLKSELSPVYGAWGIADAGPLATTELRRIFKEKGADAPDAVKTFVEAELARIESFEAAFTKSEAAPNAAE